MGDFVAYLGLGSNLGNSREFLGKAIDLLGRLPTTQVEALSRVYLTASVGGPQQPDYLNMVVELRTSLAPRDLLSKIQNIENSLKRVRDIKWGPRTIDIDILWYDGFTFVSEDLEVPHPRMEQRRFVLEPLAELAPNLILPSGRKVEEALVLVAEQKVDLFEDWLVI